MLDMVARLARPLALAAALLLIVGVSLTGLSLLLIGWSLYAIGHVGVIAALLALAVANRQRLDAWAWLALLALKIGLVLALPQIALIWQGYAQGGSWLPVAGREMELPVWTAPFGLTAELVTWVGLAFFGLAARGARALPAGIGWVMVVAALIGIAAALYIISPYGWVAAVLLFALALLGVGVALHRPALRLAQSG